MSPAFLLYTTCTAGWCGWVQTRPDCCRCSMLLMALFCLCWVELVLVSVLICPYLGAVGVLVVGRILCAAVQLIVAASSIFPTVKRCWIVILLRVVCLSCWRQGHWHWQSKERIRYPERLPQQRPAVGVAERFQPTVQHWRCSRLWPDALLGF